MGKKSDATHIKEQRSGKSGCLGMVCVLSTGIAGSAGAIIYATMHVLI